MIPINLQKIGASSNIWKSTLPEANMETPKGFTGFREGGGIWVSMLVWGSVSGVSLGFGVQGLRIEVLGRKSKNQPNACDGLSRQVHRPRLLEKGYTTCQKNSSYCISEAPLIYSCWCWRKKEADSYNDPYFHTL